MNVLALLLAVVQPLWPEGRIPDFQEGQVAATTKMAEAPGFVRADHRMPYLDWYAAPTSNRTDCCMLIISGGGYVECCDWIWVDKVAEHLTARGFQCVSLVYRTPRPQGLPIYQSGWEDGQRAVRMVRAEAARRGFSPEKIGAVGFSAGSHLTVLLATSSQTPAYAKVDATDEIPCHLNWAVPIYTAYALTDGLTGPNARQGDAPDVRLNPCFKFDAKTCPMCMIHGGVDVYSPNGSTQIYRQLRRMKVPAELHLMADRSHGFARPDSMMAIFDRWIGRMDEFMRQLNIDGRLGEEVDLIGERFKDDSARASCEQEPIWPKGRMPDVQTNQCTPYLEWHFPKKLTTKAIQIIYSGGSYMGNGTTGFEVAPARRFLNEKGMTVVTMKYRTPRPPRESGLQKHVTAWQDLQRAIRIVRSKAASKGLDPDRIGIMGSSAGGHLTLMGATSSRHQSYLGFDEIDRLPCTAQWAVAIYPAYALTDGENDGNATGGNDDSARLVPEFSFDLDTCPILFIHGDADGWAAMNSVKCWEQLRRMGIQGELHTLVTRGHCFQRKAAPGTGSYNWLDRIWDFMSAKGYNR